MMKISLFLVVALQSAGSVAPVADSVRGRRIVWGTPLVDYKAYSVVGYYTVIADGNTYSFNLRNLWTMIFPYGIAKPIPSAFQCGGALLTRTVVYTACHCLVNFVNVNDSYARAKVRNPWEAWFTVFVGWTIANEMEPKDGAWLKLGIVHQKCSKIFAAISFDYGLILLQKPVGLSLPHMKPAPIHTTDDIAAQYVTTMRKELICLYVGYGYYNYIDKDNAIPGEQSPFLQHGWRATTSHFLCRLSSMFWFHNTGVDGNEHHTWLCSAFFGKQRAAMMKGDSGSPVSCNDVRVGFVSFGSQYPYPWSKEEIGAIAFDMEDNAAEFRESLEETLKGYIEGHSDWRPSKQYTVLPPGYTVGSIDQVLFQEQQDFKSEASRISVSLIIHILPLILQ